MLLNARHTTVTPLHMSSILTISVGFSYSCSSYCSPWYFTNIRHPSKYVINQFHLITISWWFHFSLSHLTGFTLLEKSNQIYETLMSEAFIPFWMTNEMVWHWRVRLADEGFKIFNGTESPSGSKLNLKSGFNNWILIKIITIPTDSCCILQRMIIFKVQLRRCTGLLTFNFYNYQKTCQHGLWIFTRSGMLLRDDYVILGIVNYLSRVYLIARCWLYWSGIIVKLRDCMVMSNTSGLWNRGVLKSLRVLICPWCIRDSHLVVEIKKIHDNFFLS